jgi:hypothetical protein
MNKDLQSLKTNNLWRMLDMNVLVLLVLALALFLEAPSVRSVAHRVLLLLVVAPLVVMILLFVESVAVVYLAPDLEVLEIVELEEEGKFQLNFRITCICTYLSYNISPLSPPRRRRSGSPRRRSPIRSSRRYSA